ncbi:MAG: hypothetical protein HQM16_11360 [Deltaproteobacteria bacterium]|nr:hypothetical protein [Deltaproteobacteria bacterium]
MLRRLLQERRNPHYESRLKAFEAKIKDLSLNANTRVSPAPFFEEDYVEISSKISTPQDIADLINILKDDHWLSVLGVEE